jgi:hypothetical protein
MQTVIGMRNWAVRTTTALAEARMYCIHEEIPTLFTLFFKFKSDG